MKMATTSTGDGGGDGIADDVAAGGKQRAAEGGVASEGGHPEGGERRGNAAGEGVGHVEILEVGEGEAGDGSGESVGIEPKGEQMGELVDGGDRDLAGEVVAGEIEAV